MLYLLGTGAAFTDPHRTTTMLAFSDAGRTIVVDCGGDVVQRLQASNLDPATLDALILTHEHPDHVGGFALFMEKLWLSGRVHPIPVYGIESALSQARRLFETFDTSRWDGLPEIVWHTVPLAEDAPVYDDEVWRITASPSDHSVPCIGLRVEHRPSGRVCAYSCDTRPTPAITRLAAGADILVHEATGEGYGHSSVEQAAQVAVEAGVKKLILVHLPLGLTETDLRAARSYFPDTTLGVEQGVETF